MFYQSTVKIYRWQNLDSEEGRKALLAVMPCDQDRKYLHHEFKTCMVCGLLEWCSSHHAPPDFEGETEYRFDYEEGWSCSDCEEVQRRAPEIFEWARRMTLHMVYLRQKENTNAE